MRDLILQLSKSSIYSTKPLPVFTVQGTAIISNQQEAEVGIVYGVGPKRVFGCGFMHLAGQ